MTPAGIETATFRLVAQHLNHCATVVPTRGQYQMENKLFRPKAGLVEVKKRKCETERSQTVRPSSPYVCLL